MATTVRCTPKNLSREYTGKTRTRWLCRVESEHDVEHVVSSDYFGQMKQQFQVGDVIEIEWEDYSRFGELQVRATPQGVSQVVTAIRSLTEYEESELPEGYEVEWKGGLDFHVILHDGKEVEAGFRSHDEAAIRAWRIDADARADNAARRAATRTGRIKTVQTPKPAAKKRASVKEDA